MQAAGSTPSLAASINLAGCGESYYVDPSNGGQYSFNVTAPQQPIAGAFQEATSERVTRVELVQSGSWRNQQVSNGESSCRVGAVCGRGPVPAS
jgi:hypothetical protein